MSSFRWAPSDAWTSLKARFFVFCCGLAFTLAGFIANPEDSRQAFLRAEEYLRKLYWGDSC